jgi:soluble lytic murein transglycosylase
MRFLIIIALLLALSFPLLAQTNEGIVAALQARRTGSSEAAVALLRQVAADQNHPLSDYAQFEIGEIFYAAGEYSATLPEYYQLVTQHHGSLLQPRANLNLGKSYFNLNNYPRAVKTFQHLIQKYPEAKEAAEARYFIARALEKEGSWKEAYLAYEEADLYHPLSYFGKKSRLAIRELKKKHKKKLPHFKASEASLFKKGMTCFEQDDYEMAANIFSRLAREYPRSKYVGRAWLMLGRAELQTDSPAAIPNLERAANFDGKAYYYLGLAHGRRGNFEKAIASLQKVTDRYPESGLADEAAYWIAYYLENTGDAGRAMTGYYNVIKNYPYSKSVPAAIWRLGRIYYWKSDFKNAAYYLHLAQLYTVGEDTPRCYYFEAKALERLGNRAAALEVYKKLVERFDHTYYAYRALERSSLAPYKPESFSNEEFSFALNELDGKNEEELAAIMEIWEQTNAEVLTSENSQEARVHLEKYKELMSAGFTNYAADEARYLVNITSDTEKESLQTRLGEALISAGNYRTPIRFADRKVKAAVLAGKPQSLPRKVWQLAYPKGYWKQVSEKAGRYKLDPYLVLAVIREESHFNPKATSRSNAKGLMQIIPGTGRAIAQDLDLDRYRTSRLYEATLNIEMGSYYLSNLIRNFSNNTYLALAGYNGGPNRIKRYVKNWYNGDLGTVDIDEFVESIPRRETRLYVQKVMGSYFEYKRLYDRKRG